MSNKATNQRRPSTLRPFGKLRDRDSFFKNNWLQKNNTHFKLRHCAAYTANTANTANTAYTANTAITANTANTANTAITALSLHVVFFQ